MAICAASAGISIHALREEGDVGRYRQKLLPADFYPRPPRGGRPVFCGYNRKLAEISIHALREEGDTMRRGKRGGVYRISIHALREEGDLRPCSYCPPFRYFYPRPPRGGRLRYITPWARQAQFLSTPSARRATRVRRPRYPSGRISIHALREEGDSKNREKTLCFCLIIHLSAQIAKRCL